MEREELIKQMNQALADEWLAHYQYWLGAKVIKGPLKDEIVRELVEHSGDELRHAGMLADRIVELGGTPLMSPEEWFEATGCGYEAPEDYSPAAIVEQNIDGEKCAIDTYKALVQVTKDRDPKSHEMFLEILADEKEHKEDLERLQKALKSV